MRPSTMQAMRPSTRAPAAGPRSRCVVSARVPRAPQPREPLCAPVGHASSPSRLTSGASCATSRRGPGGPACGAAAGNGNGGGKKELTGDCIVTMTSKKEVKCVVTPSSESGARRAVVRACGGHQTSARPMRMGMHGALRSPMRMCVCLHATTTTTGAHPLSGHNKDSF
jgi:hypothetical protein